MADNRDEQLAVRSIAALCVEDSALAREQLAQLMRRRVESVETAVDGLDALEKLEQHRPDLVITDVVMPRMDGVTLARALKSRFPEIPVVLVTATMDVEKVTAAIEIGVDRYLLKPIKIPALNEAVQHCAGLIWARQSVTLADELIGAVGTPIVIMNASGRIMKASGSFASLMDCEMDLILGHDIRELVSPHAAAQADRLVDDAGSAPLALALRGTGGTDHPVTVSSRPLHGSGRGWRLMTVTPRSLA